MFYPAHLTPTFQRYNGMSASCRAVAIHLQRDEADLASEARISKGGLRKWLDDSELKIVRPTNGFAGRAQN
ncbi:hypothetical protein PAXRUDRAFT_828429 [Paxillus rubicundulus Ve08.2h10]|uniref:Uncharacterized protein n=1 Tax=Paxillus rubicundulus Ve08.2h10 TaxID=930991 RepID=A0A0D0E1B3_9AGAM|nr:hypothetical protein PAXRUDRAFT_828429 [Paxillus rubicundulus Ve08.2h10]